MSGKNRSALIFGVNAHLHNKNGVKAQEKHFVLRKEDRGEIWRKKRGSREKHRNNFTGALKLSHILM